MQLPNPQNTTLQEMLPRLQQLYPGAVIKKPWLSPEMISIPVENFRLFVRRRKNGRLITDFQPPMAWGIMAMVGVVILFSALFTLLLRSPTFAGIGWLPIVLAVVLTKAIFKSRNKERLARFDTDVARASEGAEEGSIF